MTSIEWTDATWNPVRGCSRISEGCRNCYAERMAARFSAPGETFDGFARRGVVAMSTEPGEAGKHYTRWTGRVELIPSKLDEPLHWRKPRRVFVNSMSDLFHEGLPDEAIDRVFAVMSLAEGHTFQILTKRADRMLRYLASRPHDRNYPDMVVFDADPEVCAISRVRSDWPLPNVWIGVSCEDQKTADERIPLLLQTPAAVRFVSLEPLLGPIDFSDGPLDPDNSTMADWSNLDGLDWVIVGGESGPGARPCDVAWIRSIVRQCREAGVACFVKQLGARPFVVEGSQESRLWSASQDGSIGIMDDVGEIHMSHSKGGDPEEWPEDLRVREFPA